ncbi:hypothetical protein [Saccharomonospora piscinae]|uniref:hypothetical protein n=1 Tax=Saccharomonospora piscinae TaxID=687388 RepID=UPI0004662856|nr:hypothetical protein [Saccharomonospora piscinae]
MGDTDVTVLDQRVPERHRSTGSATPSGGRDAGVAVRRAEESFRSACAALTRQEPDARALRAAVRGTARLTHTLATTIDSLVEAVRSSPRAVGDEHTTDDLLADLRALRHCLTAGAAVIDPALDDLRDATGGEVEADFARRYREWAAATPATGTPL